jgi:hypothetical protein
MCWDFVGIEFGEKTNPSKINTDYWESCASTKASCVDDGTIATKDNRKITACKRRASAFLALVA